MNFGVFLGVSFFFLLAAWLEWNLSRSWNVIMLMVAIAAWEGLAYLVVISRIPDMRPIEVRVHDREMFIRGKDWQWEPFDGKVEWINVPETDCIVRWRK